MSRKKKVTKNQKTRSVVKDNFSVIERVWAEDGIVKTQLKDGQIKSLSPTDAAMRARSINEMPLPPNLKGPALELVEKIIEAVREAKHQVEDPFKNKKTEIIANMYAGKSPDGSEMTETEDQKLLRYTFMYPTLKEQEIEVIHKDKRLVDSQKAVLMEEMHKRRLAGIPT